MRHYLRRIVTKLGAMGGSFFTKLMRDLDCASGACR
jgi:hypothetical protein